MTAALEFHDSTLKAIERNGSFLVVVLSPGYVHKSAEHPGALGAGWHETVHISVAGGEAHGDLSSLPEELSVGSLQCGGTAYLNLVPIPLQFTGSISLELTSVSGRSLVVVGHSVSLSLVGTGSYVEALPWASPHSAPGAS